VIPLLSEVLDLKREREREGERGREGGTEGETEGRRERRRRRRRGWRRGGEGRGEEIFFFPEDTIPLAEAGGRGLLVVLGPPSAFWWLTGGQTILEMALQSPPLSPLCKPELARAATVLCVCLLSAPRTTLLQHCPQNNSQAH
jgi:hypothetical protein